MQMLTLHYMWSLKNLLTAESPIQQATIITVKVYLCKQDFYFVHILSSRCKLVL